MELVDFRSSNSYKAVGSYAGSGPLTPGNPSSIPNYSVPTPISHASLFGKTKGFVRGNLRTFALFAGILVLAIAVLYGGYAIYQNSQTGQVSAATAQTPINQNYKVLARDASGRAIVPTKYLDLTLVRAEKASSVMIQGKKYNTINGKLFLIIYFNIQNPDKTIYYINTADLFRFRDYMNNKIVPAVHQGTIDIRPVSTASSDVGFLINQADKNFKIELGEIDNNLKAFEIDF